MRPQQAAMHVAYNRLIEGKAEKTTWNILRRLFPLLTGRNLNDAIVLAKGTIESQQELLPKQIIKLY
jgi:predicted transposase